MNLLLYIWIPEASFICTTLFSQNYAGGWLILQHALLY